MNNSWGCVTEIKMHSRGAVWGEIKCGNASDLFSSVAVCHFQLLVYSISCGLSHLNNFSDRFIMNGSNADQANQRRPSTALNISGWFRECLSLVSARNAFSINKP